MQIEYIRIRESDGEFVVSLSARATHWASFEEFDGCGDLLSDALLDLSEQLLDAGV